MTLNVTTRYKTNASGAGKIEARSGDLRRVLPYDHALSPDANHGSAAGTLLLALGERLGDDLIPSVVTMLDTGNVAHDSDDNGGVHRFAFGSHA